MEFATFILTDEIEFLFDEVDLFLELFDGQSLQDPESLRNQRLKKNMYIDPMTNSTWRPKDKFRQLKAIITHEVKVNGTNLNKIWGTFSEVSKFGQRMKVSNTKSTPVGIFAYPAKHLLKNGMDIAFSGRPFFYIFKTNKSHLEAGLPGNDLDSTSAKNYSKLIDKFPELKKQSVYGNSKYSKFNNDSGKILNEYATKLREWAEQDEGDDVFMRSRLRGTTKDLLSWMKNEIRHAVYDRSSENLAKEVINKHTWLSNPEELIPEEDVNQSIAEIKELMEEFTPKVAFYDKDENYVREYVHLYENVGNDLSAEFGEKYRKHLDYEGEAEISLNGKMYPNSTRWTFDQLHYMDREGLFGGNSAVDMLGKAQIHKIPELQNIIDEFAQKLKELVEQIYLPVQNEVPPSYDKLPYYKKLKQFADDRGLSLDDAIKSATQGGTGLSGNGVNWSPATTANQFLYRTTQHLAYQLSQKEEVKGDWRSIWSRILRDFGISSVADTHDSKAVHQAEPTQGVFFDPKDITLIGVINLTAHSDKNDPANRPTGKTWEYGGSHRRNVAQQNQRIGTIPDESLADKDGVHRLFIGLLERARELLGRVMYSDSLHQNNFQDVDQMTTNLIKIAKAVLRLKNSGKDSYRYSMLNKFDIVVSTFIQQIDKMIRSSVPTHYPPSQQGTIDILNKSVSGIRHKIDILRQLTAGQSVKTPMFAKVKNAPEFPSVSGITSGF